MVYVRLPRPTHSCVPQAAHMVCLACINALYLSAKKKAEMSTNTDSNRRKEPLWRFGSVVISRAGFPLGTYSITAAVIWSCMVRYTADCISRLDFLVCRVARSTALPSLHCTRCIYAQQVSWLPCMHTVSSERLQSHAVRFLQPGQQRMLKFMADRRAEAELISHSGWEGSESGPLVSYCKMKCLQSFVNVLIDLCPQTGRIRSSVT